MLAEKEACLRLKGENGLLRKRYDEQQKAVEDARALLRCAEGDKRQLAQVRGWWWWWGEVLGRGNAALCCCY